LEYQYWNTIKVSVRIYRSNLRTIVEPWETVEGSSDRITSFPALKNGPPELSMKMETVLSSPDHE
jgi:hypothetical protein